MAAKRGGAGDGRGKKKKKARTRAPRGIPSLNNILKAIKDTEDRLRSFKVQGAAANRDKAHTLRVLQKIKRMLRELCFRDGKEKFLNATPNFIPLPD